MKQKNITDTDNLDMNREIVELIIVEYSVVSRESRLIAVEFPWCLLLLHLPHFFTIQYVRLRSMNNKYFVSLPKVTIQNSKYELKILFAH